MNQRMFSKETSNTSPTITAERITPYCAVNPVNVIRETSMGYQLTKLDDALFNDRELYLTGNVESDTVIALIKQIRYLNQIDSKKEIQFFIESPGGSIAAGLCLYDVLRQSKAPIRTICLHEATSMGAILFLGGARREMLPSAQLMIHDPLTMNSSSHSSYSEMKNCLSVMDNLRHVLADIISNRTGLPVRVVEKCMSRDTWFNSEEAIASGFATGIYTINPKGDTNHEKA